MLPVNWLIDELAAERLPAIDATGAPS